MQRAGVVSFLLLVAASPAVAETYHVAADGSDDAAGTADAPWATLQHAADVVAAGDVVQVHAGDYAGFALSTSGASGAEIAFVADDGARIVADNPSTPDGINVEGVSYVRLEGFTVEGATRAGIRAAECDHVTIRGNRTDANGRWGIFTAFCDDLLIEGNEASRSADEHGIYVSNSGDRPVVRHNVMWGNHVCGLHMNGDVTVGGDGVISDAVVEGNVVHDNGVGGGSGINGDGIVGARIENNLLFENHASGISLYMIDGGAPSTGNVVVNNTVVMAADGRWAVNIQDGSTGNALRNNILLHPSADRGAVDLCAACTDGFTSDFNVVVGRFTLGDQVVDLDGWRDATGGDGRSFEGTPAALFTDPASGAAGYALRDGAVAVDHGSSDDAPAVDLAGNPRPQGAGVDIGALEQCDGECAPPPGGGPGAEAGVDGGCCRASGDGGFAPALLVLVALLGRRRHSAGNGSA